MYLPKCKGDLSYNEFMEYKYKLGQSLLDNGTAKNSFFVGSVSYDDYNSTSAYGKGVAIIMEDSSEPTKETFGEYADQIKNLEKICCKDDAIIGGENYYYKVLLIGEDKNDDSGTYPESLNSNMNRTVRDLQNTENDVNYDKQYRYYGT